MNRRGKRGTARARSPHLGDYAKKEMRGSAARLRRSKLPLRKRRWVPVGPGICRPFPLVRPLEVLLDRRTWALYGVTTIKSSSQSCRAELSDSVNVLRVAIRRSTSRFRLPPRWKPRAITVMLDSYEANAGPR